MAKKTPCEGYCNKSYWKKEMTFGPDPFCHEIHGDETPVWLCDECAETSAMEI
jgi:hypothetical protein